MDKRPLLLRLLDTTVAVYTGIYLVALSGTVPDFKLTVMCLLGVVIAYFVASFYYSVKRTNEEKGP